MLSMSSNSSTSAIVTAMANTTLAPIQSMDGVTPETLIISLERDNVTHVTQLQDLQNNHQSLSFILVPILLILGVALFSGVAIYCIQKRQRLENLRHTLIPLYTFNKDDEDEWGVLLDNCGNNGHSDRRRSESRCRN